MLVATSDESQYTELREQWAQRQNYLGHVSRLDLTPLDVVAVEVQGPWPAPSWTGPHRVRPDKFNYGKCVFSHNWCEYGLFTIFWVRPE